MIDFRYHLVSIVSIFLALAVGIVLGAGPLQQQIGQTLTNQVSQLRKDKAELRSQLDTQAHELEAADQFAEAVTPELVGSRLGGRSVVLVMLPGADSSVADDITRDDEDGRRDGERPRQADRGLGRPGPGQGGLPGPAEQHPRRRWSDRPHRRRPRSTCAWERILAKALVVSNVADADRSRPSRASRRCPA